MPSALGGAPLVEGSRLVRITYIDESGTNPRDPAMVVAGVVVDGDKQIGPVEDALAALIFKHIPEGDRDGFFFRGSDIWNGNGYFRGKDDEWPRDRRAALLAEVVQLPVQYGLPIVFGHVPRQEYVTSLPRAPSAEELRIAIHCVAFSHMSIMLDRAFEKQWPNENTLLIAEDLQEMKDMLRAVQAVLRSAKALASFVPDARPIRHIRDTVHFAGKADSRLLQLADVCAYVIRGTISGNQAHWPYHDALAPQMVSYPKAIGFHHTRAMKAAGLRQIFQPWGDE